VGLLRSLNLLLPFPLFHDYSGLDTMGYIG
jgi:hypothetical protein